MSSYNDNLHSSVVTSLDAQELELQNVEANLEASMFSLYYAQCARITTAEELEVTTAKYAYQKKVYEQAIIDSDLSTNVLQSANNAKDYTDKSVSNTAVAAANLQIAANAILKLASDTGSIFSIVNAADFDTDIYAQSNKAYVLMNDTAYEAEKASQHSMEASASISEVTTTTLADKATATDTSIKDLLALVTKQYDDTTALLSSQGAELATANTNEKKAEGILEDYSVSYNATKEAYHLNNSELNLNLAVTTPITVGNHDSYTVSFKNYKSPFNLKQADGKDRPVGYPVENYYIMLVEKSKSSTFNINDAEAIVTEGYSGRYVAITPNEDTEDGIYQKIYISGESTVDKPVLLDSEGNKLELGSEYVIFVMAVFTNTYKKSINTFDDYLSAPSKKFVLKNQLSSANAGGIQAPDVKNVIQFGIFENPDYFKNGDTEDLKNIQYRCVLLPNDQDLVRGLLTTDELEYIDEEVKDREQLEALYNEKISDIQAKLYALNAQQKLDKVEDTPSKDIKSIKASAKKTTKTNSKGITDAQRKDLLNLELQVLEKEKEQALANEDHLQPGFFFNLTVAEEIPAGSYTVAEPGDMTLTQYLLKDLNESVLRKLGDDKIKALDTRLKSYVSKKSGSDTDVEQFLQEVIKLIESVINEVIAKSLEVLLANYGQFINDLILLARGYKFYSKKVTLTSETTDNFGNRLINKNDYISAIISISNNADETVNTQFTNALSDYQHTAAFTYNDPYATTSEVVAYPKQTTLN
ncbi:hypothetical protein [Kordia sp.]|uniref:hypothetical protein n=1 Tax=Kordia sp. TaxID=1965332 RepID=UPI0025C52DA7|nr:hypothetical protein [Kordia sp.]MCH2193463.1 hypothetical protein [Kordia sp.]